MSMSRRRNKQNVVSRYNGVLLSIAKKEISDTGYNIDELEGTVLNEISQSHDSTYMRYLEGSNSEMESRWWLSGHGQ